MNISISESNPIELGRTVAADGVHMRATSGSAIVSAGSDQITLYFEGGITHYEFDAGSDGIIDSVGSF